MPHHSQLQKVQTILSCYSGHLLTRHKQVGGHSSQSEPHPLLLLKPSQEMETWKALLYGNWFVPYLICSICPVATILLTCLLCYLSEQLKIGFKLGMSWGSVQIPALTSQAISLGTGVLRKQVGRYFRAEFQVCMLFFLAAAMRGLQCDQVCGLGCSRI